MEQWLPKPRKARIEERLEADSEWGPVVLEPGPVLVREVGSTVDVLRGDDLLARMPALQFHAWLGTHRVVYLSWF